MAKRRWRPLAVASVVMVTLAGAVAFRAAVDDGDPGAPPEGTATVGISATAGVSASAEAPPLLAASEPVLEKRVFAAGEQVTVRHGAGFLNAADGSLETWSRASGPAYQVRATPDGALLVVSGTEADGAPWVVARATGQTWKLARGAWPLPEIAHGMVIAVETVAGEQRQLALLDLATGRVTPVGDPLTSSFHGVVSPDGRRAAIQMGGAVNLVELGTGRLTPLANGIPADGQQRVAPLPGALGFTVLPGEAGGTRRWFSWEGAEIERALPPGAVSPGGRYVAREWSPGRIKAGGMGGYPVVSAVEIVERATGTPLVRFLGASTLPYPELGWSASGDSLVVEVPEGYRVMSAGGSTLAAIADEIHVLAPRPSPTTPGLLGTNRGTIINVPRGVTIAPAYAELPWRAHWSTRPGELIVELSSPGKGRDWPVNVLPFDVRTRNLAAPPQIVAGSETDSCVPLRPRPEAGASEVACVPDGSRGSITAAEDPSPGPKPSAEPVGRYAGVRGPDNVVWLHVQMESGTEGWARADQLGWAE